MSADGEAGGFSTAPVSPPPVPGLVLVPPEDFFVVDADGSGFLLEVPGFLLLSAVAPGEAEAPADGTVPPLGPPGAALTPGRTPPVSADGARDSVGRTDSSTLLAGAPSSEPGMGTGTQGAAELPDSRVATITRA